MNARVNTEFVSLNITVEQAIEWAAVLYESDRKADAYELLQSVAVGLLRQWREDAKGRKTAETDLERHIRRQAIVADDLQGLLAIGPPDVVKNGIRHARTMLLSK